MFTEFSSCRAKHLVLVFKNVQVWTSTSSRGSRDCWLRKLMNCVKYLRILVAWSSLRMSSIMKLLFVTAGPLATGRKADGRDQEEIARGEDRSISRATASAEFENILEYSRALVNESTQMAIRQNTTGNPTVHTLQWCCFSPWSLLVKDFRDALDLTGSAPERFSSHQRLYLHSTERWLGRVGCTRVISSTALFT